MHPAGNTANTGGCAATDSAVRGAVQHGATAQRDWLHDAGRHAGRASGGDPRGAGSQVGRSSPAAAKAPAGSCLRRRATMTLPGETEAGSAGMQPCRGIPWWAHRDDAERESLPFALSPKPHRIGRPYALKIPAPKGRNTYQWWSAPTPFHAEPEQTPENGPL